MPSDYKRNKLKPNSLIILLLFILLFIAGQYQSSAALEILHPLVVVTPVSVVVSLVTPVFSAAVVNVVGAPLAQ